MSEELNKKLIKAVKIGYLDGVQRFIVDGADPNTVSNDEGDTVLMDAVWDGHVEIANVLLLAGANLHAKNSTGTVLHVAAHGGHAKSVNLLLEREANPHTKNKGGQTALDVAKSKGATEIVRALEKAMK